MKHIEKIEPYTGRLSGEALRRYNILAVSLGLKNAAASASNPQNEAKTGNIQNKSAKPEFLTRIPVRNLLATVATAAAAFAAGIIIYTTAATGHKYNEMRIAAADHTQEVLLPDSSYVSVYPASTMIYRETKDGERETELSGAAFFRVSNHEGKPFRVSVAAIRVNVTGTDFEVYGHSDDRYSSVSLFSGSVDVDLDNETVAMTCGENLTYDCSTGRYTVSMIAPDRMISKGYKPRLKFDGATLGEILRALEAVYGIEISAAADIGVNDGEYSLNLEEETLEQALQMLVVMNNDLFSYRIEEKKITITRKGTNTGKNK